MDLISGCKPLGYKWIFTKKIKVDGTIDKYKERLAIKEFRQQEGLYYFDTYSTQITTVKMILAIAALRNEVHQIDVKMAFLNGDLENVLYMNQPEGFMAPGPESKVCRLVKSSYSLRKALKQGHQFSPYHNQPSVHDYNEHDYKDLTRSGRVLCECVLSSTVTDVEFKDIASTQI
ncbi:calcineurin B-like protein 4 [Tanacetum coccineum]